MNTINRYLKSPAFRLIVNLEILIVALSYIFFQRQSLRLDESQSLWQTSHSAGEIIKIISTDVHVPLYHMILHGWQYLFGNDVSVARILSLLFFMLSIPAIYALGKLAYSARIGLFTAGLMAISPFMNWYGNEIRMYSMFVLITILNQYFFLSIFKKNTDGAWIGFFLTACVGMYTHYFFFLMLSTDALFFIFYRKLFSEHALKRFLKVCALLFVVFLPWIITVISSGGFASSEPNLVAPDSVNIFNTFSQFVFGFQTDHLNTILISLWPITVLLGFFSLRKNRRIAPETLYFILGFIVPNIIAFVASIALTPVYLTRYLIFTLPMMYLLLAWLFSTYQPTLERICKVILVTAMLTTLVIEALSTYTPAKENYREAVDYINSRSTPADVIVVSAPFTIYPVSYYYHGVSTLTTLPIWDQSKSGGIPPFSEEKLPAEVESIKGTHQNMWLLLSYDQGYEQNIRLYFDTHFERLDVKQFSPGMMLYEYKLRY